MADLFASLSLSAFQSNALLASRISAPSWSVKQWTQPQDSPVFSSNLVLTRGGFRNGGHEDRDASKYSLGTWALVESKTGQLISSDRRKKLIHDQKHGSVCNALGAKFHIVNVVLHLDEADFVAMTFNSHVRHFTSHPDLQDNSSDSEITRCSTSNQTSKTIVTALEKISNVRGDLSEEDWLKIRPKYGRSYVDEVQKKKKTCK